MLEQTRFYIRAGFYLFCFMPILAAFAAPMNNQLKDHPAPYLALHGDDPVQWQKWNQKTVERAREENKIIFLSIGYYACHWCHVMQQESYQDSEIAEVVNRHFIPVKIDRELEPALDRQLMDFTQRILGRGGWPLNVFVTPDGYPIYSLLYAPPYQFMATLERLYTLWEANPQKVLDVVRSDTLKTFPEAGPNLENIPVKQILEEASAKILQRGDIFEGGFGEQQKFPSTPQVEYLLTQYESSPDQETREFLETTLNAMARLGLQDHLLGGFFRYSVDPGWQIPHFEKMLYDNANLAGLYLQAAKILKSEFYAQVAHRTLQFMETEMWHDDGALVSAFSAVDDDSVEGGSYLWQVDEIVEHLSEQESRLIFSLWELNKQPELPAGNHPRYVQSIEDYAAKHNIPVDEVRNVFQAASEKLITLRKKRSLPVDDKLLAGWNGLALSAFIQASRDYPEKNYLQTAQRLRDFLINRLWDGEQLYRALAKGEIYGSASLEDYAYVGRALFEWAELTGQQSDYDLAAQIIDQGWQRFYRQNGWYEGDDTLLAPTSGAEMISDSPSASPSAMLIDISLKLAAKTEDKEMKDRALSALNRGEAMLTLAPFWYVGQLTALQTALNLL